MANQYEVSANGTVFGTYTADSEQAARDLCAQDAGYKSEADMVAQLERKSELVARLIKTAKIEITIGRDVSSNDWPKVASRKAKAAAEEMGINWIDAEILVKLPELGRCMTKAAGETAFIAHG